MTEVLFGQGYSLRFDPKAWDARQPYPPLATLYAASYLRAHGHDVAFFDAMLEDSDRGWGRSLDRHQPRLAVIYEDSFNYLTKMCLTRMREATLAMIDMARARGCAVVVSGSDAADHPELYLGRGASAVLIGEGEVTLEELLDAMTSRGGAVPETVAGLCLRGENGAVRRTPPRGPLRDLDALPFPAWDLVSVAAYRQVWQARHGYHSMNMVTTRGCPYHCNWCAKPVYGQVYSVRSPGNVAEEMALLKREYRPDHVWFADDIFGLKPGWVGDFARAVAARDAVIPFKCLSRVDLLSEGVVAALARAGCRSVWVGAESGSQKVLDAMEKGTHVEQIHAAARRLRAAGIEVGFFLQFGYPGETRADVEQTLQMVRDCRPDDIGVSVSYPLPGTRFHERVRHQIGTKQNWTDSNDLAMLYRGPFGGAFYRSLYRVVHKEHRLRRLDERKSGAAWRRAAARFYHKATLPWERLRLERMARLDA